MKVRLIDDPAYFISTILKMDLHSKQKDFLLSNHGVKVLVGGRRSGKSTVMAAEICYYIARSIADQSEFKQIIVAPTLDQAKLLFKAFKAMLEASPLGGCITNVVESPFPELRYTHGSVIVRALGDGGHNLRGHSANRVIIDEAAYLANNAIVESITPILADTGGQLVVASTPRSQLGWFYEYYQRGLEPESRYKSFKFKTLDNSFIDESFVENQKNEVSALQWAAEYDGEFIQSSDSFFPFDRVIACATGTEESPISGVRYAIGYDPARKADKSAVAVTKQTVDGFALVKQYDISNRDTQSQADFVKELSDHYFKAQVVIDETGMGGPFVDILKSAGVFLKRVTFTNKLKIDIMTRLSLLIEQGRIVLIESKDLLDEFSFYQMSDNGSTYKLGAKSGANDDMITALALSIYGFENQQYISAESNTKFELPFFTSSSFEKSYSNVYGKDGLPANAWGEVDNDDWL